MSSRPTRGTARLAAILDALPDALLLVNSNGTVVDANAAAVRTLQAPGSSLVGMGVLDLLPEFDPSRIPGSMRPRTRGEDGAEEDDGAPVRMSARRTDGTVFPVEVSGNEFEDDGLLGGGLGENSSRDGYGPYDSYGGVSRYGYGASGGGSGRPADRQLLLIVVRDLSGRLEVEAELRRQHKQTEMILRAAAEGVLGVDIDGRVVLVNPAAAHILGYRASELGGQELLPLVQHSKPDGTPQPAEESPLADTLASGRKHRVRTAVLWRKDGRPVSVELSTAPVRDGDQLVGAVMTFTDRSAYLALAARHKHLTAVLEEELKEPLTRLQTTLEKLAADPAGQLWPEANWVLRRLAADISRSSRLVDGVLSYQRFDAALDAGRETLDRRPIGLDQVVRRAVAAATELVGEDRVRFAVHPSEVEVIADQERLAQALGHLIADVASAADSPAEASSGSNAGLYGMAVGVASGLTGTPAQGPTVVIAAAQRGSVARIEVRGPSAGGSPVHLPIARGMVERHGGVLQSHELPGKQGRTYVVELPLDPATAQEAAERAAAAARTADRPKENDTAMLPELPGMGGPQPQEAPGAGVGAALPAARRSDESLPGRAPERSTGGGDSTGGGAGGGAGNGGSGSAGSETPAEGIDRSRRRRALPAPEVVRPPRAVTEAQQAAGRQQREEEERRAQGQGQVQNQGQSQGTGTNGFPGLIGGPVYPGLEHALPPAGARLDTPAPAAVAELPAPSGGRRRRLAMPPGTDDGRANQDAANQGAAASAPLELEPVPVPSQAPAPAQQSQAPQPQAASGPAALQPVPAAAPFGGRFGPDGGGGTVGGGSAALAPSPDSRALEAGPDQADQGADEAAGTESRLEFIAGADYPTMVAPAADGRPRRLLVWPEPDPSTRQALQDRGYRPVIVRTREEVEGQVAGFPAALFVDPLTGPITRTALQSLRSAAGDANVPVLVTAGLGQATREAAYGADPAVLLRALAPRDSERHAPRVLLVEQDPDIAAAFTATLERRGMHVVHALSENDAVEKAGSVQPNLVVMDLMLIRRRRVGIVDWLRGSNQLHRTPLVVYTSVDGPAESSGLRSGETVLFLAERSTSAEVQARIVDLLGKIGSLGQ
ncbi:MULTISPECIES: PAS domain-containing protein [Streptacidiphilus]|uniref:histidine kinase n=1 Tax=Streptacidiphilus cavernicola TaxID=3342716 RepID=A0ABV6UGY8_9ACTN|nr:PAS domain-containing protein [Streptacidiphilus jeojiense]